MYVLTPINCFMQLKRIFPTVAAIVFFSFSSHAALPVSVAASKIDSVFSVGPTLYKQELMIMQMKRFVSMTPEEYGKLRGKKLNFFQRMAFNMTQHRMKRMLSRYDYGDPSIFQKISWLLRGLVLGPIALLLVYAFARDEERELIKWVWYGFAGWVIWVGILLIVLAH